MAYSQQRAGSKSIRSTNHMDAFHYGDCEPWLPDAGYHLILQNLPVVLYAILITPGANRHARSI